MKRVGFVGWRGMVGSVLLERMKEEGDFAKLEPVFFSTSQAGKSGPDLGGGREPLGDAFDTRALGDLDMVVTCQGSSYTKRVYPELRGQGWNGYWLDASSAKRMDRDTVIVLDPVNLDVIKKAFTSGVKSYSGANCTVSLMLMALSGLFRAGLIEWLSTMTYQAASGAGANNMRELIRQMCRIVGDAHDLSSADAPILELDRVVSETLKSPDFPTSEFGVPLACSLIPWIDAPLPSGQTREEWKGMAETNKILQTKRRIPVDGICVRVGSMRCHSQALTIKLTRSAPLDELESIIAEANPWVRLIPNEEEKSIKGLSPAAVSGTLDVPIGRLRKLNMGPEYLTAFTVGDQLLWGAAEPIRRALEILLSM